MSGDSKQKFTERVNEDPYIIPEKMTTGISSRTGEITEAARMIDPILSDQVRVKHELNVARSTLGVHKNCDFVGELKSSKKNTKATPHTLKLHPKKTLLSSLLHWE
ncbi:hypothetical protein [Parasitella parasitica]|uniref:Uncharacterized protein n=1 Tax=Parasitella parasitica TaxID=35722 RepID=A0A0B7NKA5_9FUNG|nr:hypothetical protein [Parasitella parasitica]